MVVLSPSEQELALTATLSSDKQKCDPPIGYMEAVVLCGHFFKY